MSVALKHPEVRPPGIMAKSVDRVVLEELERQLPHFEELARREEEFFKREKELEARRESTEPDWAMEETAVMIREAAEAAAYRAYPAGRQFFPGSPFSVGGARCPVIGTAGARARACWHVQQDCAATSEHVLKERHIARACEECEYPGKQCMPCG
jgi:hypothetical protein